MTDALSDSAGGNGYAANAEEVRHRQALALVPGSPQAVPALIAFMSDPSWRVRKTAVLVLDRFVTDPTLVPALVSGLAASDNAGLRNACAEALVRLGDRATSNLVAALRTPDPDHRKFVVEVLGRLGSEPACEALIEALVDRDENVRVAAVESLGRIAGPKAIGALTALLGADADVLQRVYVLDALAEARARVAFDLLAAWLGDAQLKRQVFRLLGFCRDARALAPLCDGLLAPVKGTRAAAVQAQAEVLGDLGTGATKVLRAVLAARPEALAMLHALIEDPDEEAPIVEAAMKVLGALGDPQEAPGILAACACRTFVQTGVEVVIAMGRAIVPPLIAAIDRVSVEARVLFIEMLEALGDATSAPALLEVAGCPEARAAEAALQALGRLGGADVVEPLMALVRRADREIARQGALALANIGLREPAAVAAAVRGALRRGEHHPGWLLVLGSLGQDQDVDVVSMLIHHRDPEVRRASIEAAGQLDGRVPVDNLIYALADENAQVRAAAARALGIYSAPAVVEALLAAARDPNAWVAAAAVMSLGAVGTQGAVPTLLAATQASSSPVAIAALRGLLGLNPEGLDKVVEKALTHADPEVAREAIGLSVRLCDAAAAPILASALSHRFWTVRLAAAEVVMNRGLEVPQGLLRERVALENEPMVRDILERLARRRGGLS